MWIYQLWIVLSLLPIVTRIPLLLSSTIITIQIQKQNLVLKQFMVARFIFTPSVIKIMSWFGFISEKGNYLAVLLYVSALIVGLKQLKYEIWSSVWGVIYICFVGAGIPGYDKEKLIVETLGADPHCQRSHFLSAYRICWEYTSNGRYFLPLDCNLTYIVCLCLVSFQ